MKKIIFFGLVISLISLNLYSQVLNVNNKKLDYWGNNHVYIIDQARQLLYHDLGFTYEDILNHLETINFGDLQEDEIDLVYGLGGVTGWGVTTTHFWNADLGDDQKNSFGYTYDNIDNAYTKVRHYIDGNYELHITDENDKSHHFQYPGANNDCGLVNYFKTGYVYCTVKNPYTQQVHGWETHSPYCRTEVTYQLLGHMIHLLQDMTVPVHVHVNQHPQDDYEEYVGTNGLPGYQTAGTFKNPFNPVNYGADPIRGLFYTANQIADLFPCHGSGFPFPYNLSGNNTFTNVPNSVLSNTYYNFLNGGNYYQDFNMVNQRNYLGNHTINSTAGLLYWFAVKANLTQTYAPVISNITTNMVGNQQIGYTLYNGQTGILYSTTQGTNITQKWNYTECENIEWGGWPFDLSHVISYYSQYNPNFGATNNGFTGASCSIDKSLPGSKYLRARLLVYNSIGSVWSDFYKIQPQVASSGGGCPYIFVLGNDTSGGKFFTENNILHHSEFTENANQSITDVYKLKTVPKIDSNKITIQIMETENDVNYFDQIKLFAVDHPVGSKIGITESNDIVMYYPDDVSSSDLATKNYSINNIAPYIQYGQPSPKITGLSNDFINASYDSTSQNSKMKSYKNRIKAKGYKSTTDSLALIGEIGSDTYIIANNSTAKDWAGSISIYTNSDTYTKPFSKRVNVSDVIIPFSQTNDNVDKIDINFNSDYAMSYFSVVPVSYEGFTKTELSLISAIHAINGNILSSLSNIDNNFAIMDTTAIIDLKFGSINPPDPSMVRDYVFVVNGKYTSENSSKNGHQLSPMINNNVSPNNVTYKYKLNANYPNPFNPSTKINYELEKSGFTKLEIFDILGRSVKVLVNEYKQAGNYTFEFNGSNLPSGVYIYRLESNGFVSTKRMVLIK